MSSPPQLLPSYSVRSIRQQGQSYFVDADSVRLPSVTAILNATKPEADREALARWRARVGAAEAGRIATTASRRGTGTHKQIKQYLLGQAADCPELVQPYWQSILPVLANLQAVRLIEGAVLHYDLGYAGKVDCIASYRGVPCICDWKTSDQPKGSLERLYDGPLQLAAYCGAANHCYADAGLTVKHALLVVAIAHQPAEIFWFEPEDLLPYWQQWHERVEQYHRRYRWTR